MKNSGRGRSESGDGVVRAWVRLLLDDETLVARNQSLVCAPTGSLLTGEKRINNFLSECAEGVGRTRLT